MTQQSNIPKTSEQMVTEARERIETLTPEQVASQVKLGATLIDLRESEERVQHGIISGALHFPRGMLEFWADPKSPDHRPEFDPNHRIILHCMGGGRSALAADTLHQLGFIKVAHMDGGFERWKQEGLPVKSAKDS